MRSLFILFLSCFLIAQARAQTQSHCPDLDLSSRMGPVRALDGASWCWAATDADLIGFNQKLAPPQQISAYDVAIQNLAAPIDSISKEKMKFAPTAQTYPIDRPIEAYRHAVGYCTEAQLPSQYHKQSADEDENVTDMATHQFLNAQLAKYAHVAKPICKYSNPDELAAAANLLVVRQARWGINHHECKDRQPFRPALGSLRVQTVTAAQDPSAHIAQILGTAPRHPVGIGYNPNFLFNGRAAAHAGAPPDHAGSIVGMHWNGHECQFKLRDSTGLTPNTLPNEFRSSYDNGYIWVKASDLNTSVGLLFDLP